ncbi:MAG: hypothetical protein AB7F86_19680, partial [Bdellovibrionales bacterium]
RIFTYLQRNQPRAIGSALGFNAIGLIMGGIGIKILIFYLGFARAEVTVLALSLSAISVVLAHRKWGLPLRFVIAGP